MASIESGNVLLNVVSELGDEITKQVIREKVWEYMESNKIADNPLPVKNRIPNFLESAEAGNKLCELEEFKKASYVKINIDKPQRQIRLNMLSEEKALYVSTSRMIDSVVSKIVPPKEAPKKVLRTCASSIGATRFAENISVETTPKFDVLVVGSVAVSPNGTRIGRGQGWSDIDFALLNRIGAVTPQTVIVTAVHDCQVINLPDNLVTSHDFSVDIIVTPTQVIRVANSKVRPSFDIDWNILTIAKYKAIPILKEMRIKDKESGKDVKLSDQTDVDPDDLPNPVRVRKERPLKNTDKNVEEKRLARRKPVRNARKGGRRNSKRYEDNENANAQNANSNKENSDGQKPEKRQNRRRSKRSENDDGGAGDKKTNRQPLYAIWMGRLAKNVRVSELKTKIRDCGVVPIHIVWRPQTRSAFLLLLDAITTNDAVGKLADFEVSGCKPVVEMSRRTKERMDEEKGGAVPQEIKLEVVNAA